MAKKQSKRRVPAPAGRRVSMREIAEMRALLIAADGAAQEAVVAATYARDQVKVALSKLKEQRGK